MNKNSYFDLQVFKIFSDLEEEAAAIRVNRINSTMLLKALLEAEESPLYDALLEQLYDMVCLPEITEETYSYLPVPEQEEANGVEDNKKPQISFIYNNETKSIFFDDDLKDFLELIGSCIQLNEQVNIWRFTAFFVLTMTSDVRKVLRTFNVKIDLLKKHFTVNDGNGTKAKALPKTGSLEIPDELKSFVRNLNEELKGKICDISGRERECELVWQTMAKKTKRNVVLVGDAGTGKSSIAQKITFDIINGTCPEIFKGFTVLSLNVTSSVAGTMYRGQAEERFSALVDYLENQPNIILFIDEMHLINGAGACRDGDIDLANALKPVLAGDRARVIGATTSMEYENYLSKDEAIQRRFRPVYVKEPKMKEVYPMLKKSIETLSKYHGVSISREMIDFIILNAACFNNETHNPDRTKDLIDQSMATAKLAGKNRVDKKSVLANFAYHRKKFAKMSDRAKRSTAYHEAGHCLLALCSKELKDYDVIAVSIMPTDTYLGVTVYEYNDVTPEPTLEYLIDSIAMNLAGRVAEKMFTQTITSGARSDLANATSTAYNLVTKYGMWEEFGMNRIYTEEISSDKAKDQMNEAIDKLISRAMFRAEEILTANRESLDLLVEALMKNGIVGPKDLKKILTNLKKM